MPLKVIIGTSVCHFAIAKSVSDAIVRHDPFLFRCHEDMLTASPLMVVPRQDETSPSTSSVPSRIVVVPVVVSDDDDGAGDYHPHDLLQYLTTESQSEDLVLAFFVGASQEHADRFVSLLEHGLVSLAAPPVRVLFSTSDDFIGSHAKGPFSTERALDAARSEHPTLPEVEAVDSWLSTVRVTSTANITNGESQDDPRRKDLCRESAVATIRRRLFSYFGTCDPPPTPPSFPAGGGESQLLLLSQYPGYVTAGNVRVSPCAIFGADAVWVDPSATGHEGDLVFGRVMPPPPSTGAPLVYVMDCAMQAMYFDSPFYVIAPLGNRESSTHVSGFVPFPGGVLAGRDTTHWIAGESGLVGVLECEGSVHNALAERSVAFEVLGVVVTRDAVGEETDGNAARLRPVNTLDLAKTPRSSRFATPIFAVAGTSAEAGKTTLAAKLVRILREELHYKVGAVKATGTGGVVDCAAYRDMGAEIALDQVDVGLPTTYTDPRRVADHLGDAFLLCQDAGCDVVVVEFGGDLIWANGPVVMSMAMFHENLKKLFVLCNDTFSAIGVLDWLRTAALPNEQNKYHRHSSVVRVEGDDTAVCRPACSTELTHAFHDDVIALVASPFRNFGGAVLRAEQLGSSVLQRPLDPNNVAQLADCIKSSLLRI